MKTTLFPADALNPSLEAQLAMIALEGQFSTNLSEMFRSILPSFKIRLQQLHQQLTSFSKLRDDDDLIAHYESGYKNNVVKHDRRTQDALDNAQHLDLLVFGEQLVTVPENFKGSLLLYMTNLVQIQETGLRHQNIMDNFNQYLSVFITNPELRNKATPSSLQYPILDQYRAQSTKLLKVFFPKDTGISKQALKQVLERFADLEPLVDQSHRLAYFMDEKVLHSYQDRIRHMIQLIDLIMEQYQKNSIPDVSPNLVQELSQGVYTVAQYVEFIGLLQYDGRVGLRVVDQLIEGLAHPEKWATACGFSDFESPKRSKFFAGLQTLWQAIHLGG